ncbi:MAG: HAD family hydrolase [candidate division WOR-3 bacterium]|nr:HAD family hydrolase [candidate division WOR-3 bacterium]MCX7947074.1 HAD family hydrolase [candidate division WOR-3 bacterium]MDW8149885.1 HAD-IIB family hydrolase [candidate division WOR-3 bacterium]
MIDLDGTLIDKQDRISDDKLEFINNIRNHFEITIATGRSYLSALYFVKLLDIRAPFICFDGALVCDINGNVFYSNCMNFVESFNILKLIENYSNAYFTIFYKDFSLFSSNMLSLGISLKHWRIENKIYFGGLLSKNIYKIVVASYNYDVVRSVELFLRSYRNGGFYSYPSGKRKGLYVLDIVKNSVNKGKALKFIRENFNYSFVVSIGDYINDLEMFEVSDLRIAPKISHKLIKQKANIIIESFSDLNSLLKYA